MENKRSDIATGTARPAHSAADPAPGSLTWCWHPEEELLAVFAGGARPLPDRRVCALCGELVFVGPWR